MDQEAEPYEGRCHSRYRSVRAVLCISAHWNTLRPCVNSAKTHETIHDFYGFFPELYRIEYPARGSPDLASQVAESLGSDGLPCDVDPKRGLDHGAWVPLRLMFPKAEVPLVQLSIQQSLDPVSHFALGEAIREVSESGVRAVTLGDRTRLANYRSLAPYAKEAHPYPDHYMPILTAFAAAGAKARGKVLHQSWDPGDLGMGAFELTQ